MSIKKMQFVCIAVFALFCVCISTSYATSEDEITKQTDIDFSIYSYEELIALRDQIDLAILNAMPENIAENDHIKSNPIELYSIVVEDIDSVGGVDVTIYWQNVSGEQLKYVYFSVAPYNRVGDVVSSAIGGKRTATLKITGPIYSNSPTSIYNKKYGIMASSSSWENVWYNSTISTIRISKVTVVYMDGTTYDYTGTELEEFIIDIRLSKNITITD